MEQTAEAGTATHEARSIPARLGIIALNLLTPGLGLMRLGRLRAGLGFILGTHATLLLLVGIAAIAPTATFPIFIAVFALLILASMALYVTVMVLSWRRSSFIGNKPWWSRWYALIAIWLVANVATQLLSATYHHFYKPYYIPSEGMMPTLLKNDRILADMRSRTPRRGEVIIFRAPTGGDYVKRVAAIGGDSIAMRAGIPIINGVAAEQRSNGTTRYAGSLGMQSANRLIEHLPGEQGRHAILDIEETEFDNMPPVHVPIGSVFVLGDNRDRSADSRVPLDAYGVGFVPLTAVRGRPLFITYSTADWFSRSGTRINP
jgi:signal peptidase I